MHHEDAADRPLRGPVAWYLSILRFLAGTTMLTIVAIMTAQVIARYLFGASLIWAEELCRYILIWQTFLFIGLAYSRGELVAVDIVPLMLSPGWRLALKALMAIPILAFLWLMMVNGYDYSTRFGHQIVPAVDFIFMSLIGIVVVLFLLARVAERMAAAPLPVRACVLWAMRCADASAKRFATLFICQMGLPLRFAETPLDGNDRAAVLSLASSMRILAFAIRDLTAHLRRRHFLDGRRAAAGGRPSRVPRFRMATMDRLSASLVANPDTS